MYVCYIAGGILASEENVASGSNVTQDITVRNVEVVQNPTALLASIQSIIVSIANIAPYIELLTAVIAYMHSEINTE